MSGLEVIFDESSWEGRSFLFKGQSRPLSGKAFCLELLQGEREGERERVALVLTGFHLKEKIPRSEGQRSIVFIGSAERGYSDVKLNIDQLFVFFFYRIGEAIAILIDAF